ncbi:unnamed protein product [Agarophyton chilense]|eukprot:gb/GEZJ01006365.1/.p1 GENE.gb/GEZJ01006365.1/~~gb/GEZJ01006365.1/.p1  ORF type:complete len:207 (-),score=17.75 gb/GEZJ01006365.1/:223-843(-)
MKLSNTIFSAVLVFYICFSHVHGYSLWESDQYVTSEWCEVEGDYGLCKFALDGVHAIYKHWHHVQWGTGNYTLNGSSSGPFTPRIVSKRSNFQTAIGYVKSLDTLRDVFHCRVQPDWNMICDYKTVPGPLFSTENIPGIRGSGIGRLAGGAMRRYIPNGACVPIYLTEYEVLNTSISPPRVKEVVKMPARRARVMSECVLVYLEYF